MSEVRPSSTMIVRSQTGLGVNVIYLTSDNEVV